MEEITGTVRYIKALRDNPCGGRVNKGEYGLVIDGKYGYADSPNHKGYSFTPSQMGGKFELMPEGFNPNKKPELTSLPEKWCIRLVSQEIIDIIGTKNLCNINISNVSIDGKFFVDSSTVFTSSALEHGYTEITFDQFKKWVLKEEPKTESKFVEGQVYWSNNGSNGGYIYKVKKLKNPQYVEYYAQIFLDKRKFDIDSGLNDAHQYNLRLATEEEKTWLEKCISANRFLPREVVPKESLLEEAKRRYPIGTKFNSTGGFTGLTITERTQFSDDNSHGIAVNYLARGESDTAHGYVYNKVDNKWAEIITPTAPQFKPGDWVVFMPDVAESFEVKTSYWCKPFTLKVASADDRLLYFDGLPGVCTTSCSNNVKCFRAATAQEIADAQEDRARREFHQQLTRNYPQQRFLDIETTPLKMNPPKLGDLATAMGYSILGDFGVNISKKSKPSSTVSVKLQEAQVIKGKKQKSKLITL